MKNVKNIFHNGSTFVIPICSMGNDVAELGVALLDDSGVE